LRLVDPRRMPRSMLSRNISVYVRLDCRYYVADNIIRPYVRSRRLYVENYLVLVRQYIEELVEPFFVRNQPVIVRHFFDHSAERILALPCAKLRVQTKCFRLAESLGSRGGF